MGEKQIRFQKFFLGEFFLKSQISGCCSFERSPHVQPPDHEWTRERDGLVALSWLMDLLGVELAGLTGPHQLGRVVEYRKPLESNAKCLADEGP